MCHSERELEQEFTQAVHEVECFLDIAKNMCGKHARNTFKSETYNARVEQQYYWGMLIRMITSVVMLSLIHILWQRKPVWEKESII